MDDIAKGEQGIGTAAVVEKAEEVEKSLNEGSNKEKQGAEEDKDMENVEGGESNKDMDDNEESYESERPGQKPSGQGTTTRSGVANGSLKRLGQKTRRNQGGQRRKPIGFQKRGNDSALGEIMSQLGDENFQENQFQNASLDLYYQQTIPKNLGLVKQRFLYKPFVPLPNLYEFMQELIEIRIHASYLTKFNKAYTKRNFYGSDIYTSDSDAVCILQHVNFYKVTDEEPTNFEAISVYFRVVKGRNNYQSVLRNGIKSKKMGQFDGHSIKFERAEFLKSLGTQKDLFQMTYVMPTHLEPIELHNQRKVSMKNKIICSKMPDPAYKAITPAIVFNLSLEPAIKFCLSTFADRTDDLSGRTCQKLQDNVLYIESDKKRYEISKQAGNMQESGIKYKLSLVKEPLMKDNQFFMGVKRPLDDQYLEETIAKDVDWSEFQWGERSLTVRDIQYRPLLNYKYYPTK